MPQQDKDIWDKYSDAWAIVTAKKKIYFEFQQGIMEDVKNQRAAAAEKHRKAYVNSVNPDWRKDIENMERGIKRDDPLKRALRRGY